MFALLPDVTPQWITVILNGHAVSVPAGFTAAAAMLLHGSGATRSTALSGEGRAPYCMMGVCFECLLEIDGEPNQQGCLVIVSEGMRINAQQGKRAVPA
jgi:predicted molibdopterin-dependent oxidoreductase YjgC